MDTIADVAQNAQGLRVQKLLGKSILNSFHAGWSVGAVLGGAMGAAAAALSIPLGMHLAVSGILFTAISLLAYRFMLHGPETQPEAAPAPAEQRTDLHTNLHTDQLPDQLTNQLTDQLTDQPLSEPAAHSVAHTAKWVPLAILALMAIGGMIVEDAGMTWSTLYLTQDIQAPTAVVGLGLIAFLTAHFLGRLSGDFLINRFGQRIVTRIGAAIMLIGMGASLAFPTTAGTIAGFAAAGLGVATLIPAAMLAANEIPGFRPGTGLTLVTWLMRIGAFSSPLIVGAVADHFGLRAGLLLVPLVGLIVLALSPIFAHRALPHGTAHPEPR